MSLVTVSDLRVTRRKFELHVPQLSVDPGSVVGVVGMNGAGKSTLLRRIAGLDKQPPGQVQVFGLDPYRDATKVRQQLGYMAADMPLFNMKVAELLRTVSAYYPSWDAAWVNDVLPRLALDPGAAVAKLSLGQGVRLRLVLAMAFHPRVLVLDEPTLGLDLAGRQVLQHMVVQAAGRGCAVVISSHQLQDLARIADRTLVLHHGTLLRDGPTHELVGDDRTLEEALTQWTAA